MKSQERFISTIVFYLLIASGAYCSLQAPTNLLVDWKPSGYALGIESQYPTFSWQVLSNAPLNTTTKQTSYRIIVASSIDIIDRNVGDVWDSGVSSSESSNVIFQGGNANKPTYLRKARFLNNEKISLRCDVNQHVSSIEDIFLEGGSVDVIHETLQRRCKHKRECSLNTNYDTASLVWACAANTLKPRTTYYWKVNATFGQITLPYSEPSTFTTSLWDGWGGAVAIYGSSPSGFVYLRTEENVTVPEYCAFNAAHIYVTAAESNKLTSAYLSLFIWLGSGPGRVNSLSQQQFDSFDVTAQLDNFTFVDFIPVVLAAECYHVSSGAFQLSMDFEFLCENSSLVTRTISSSPNWKAFPANSIYNPTGSSDAEFTQPHEYINGSNWIANWKASGFDDSKWPSAKQVSAFPTPLVAKQTLPIGVSVVPIAYITQVATGHYFFYLEKEVMGGIILTVNNPQSKPVTIEILLGEELKGPNSVMYQMRTGNVYQDYWVLKPGSNYLQHHEYMEFRYGEIVNVPGSLTIDDVYVWVYSYPFDNTMSAFTSSSSALNEVYELCKYTIRGTTLDAFTDSNTRERQPYEADAYITALSTLALMPSYTIIRNTFALVTEFPTWPTEWHLLTTSMAYLDYMETGNLYLAENFWNTLYSNTFIQFLNASQGLINKPVDNNGINDIIDWPAVMRDNYVLTNVDTVINAHAYHSAATLAQLGQLINKNISALQSAAATIFKNVNSKLVNNGIYLDGLNVNHSAAHATAFSLSFGLVASSQYNEVISFLVNKGMVGSPYYAHFMLQGLYNTLTSAGAQGAFDFLVSTSENSWLAMIKSNATMTSEMWNASEKPNMSWSHPWSTTPLVMIARNLMGITPTSPAYSTVSIRPQPPTSIPFNASITVPTIKGPISVSINSVPAYSDEGSLESMHVITNIPANVVATVYLPVGKSAQGVSLVVEVDGQAVKEIWEEGFLKVDNVGTGEHEVSVSMKL